MQVSLRKGDTMKQVASRKTTIVGIASTFVVTGILVLFQTGAIGASQTDMRYQEGSSRYADDNPGWYAKANLCSTPEAVDVCTHTPWFIKPQPGTKTLSKVEALRIARSKSGATESASATAKLVAYSDSRDTDMSPLIDPERPVWVVKVESPPPPMGGFPDPTGTLPEPKVDPRYTVILDGLSGMEITLIGGQ